MHPAPAPGLCPYIPEYDSGLRAAYSGRRAWCDGLTAYEHESDRAWRRANPYAYYVKPGRGPNYGTCGGPWVYETDYAVRECSSPGMAARVYPPSWVVA
jgi:hypothetical protein